MGGPRMNCVACGRSDKPWGIHGYLDKGRLCDECLHDALSGNLEKLRDSLQKTARALRAEADFLDQLAVAEIAIPTESERTKTAAAYVQANRGAYQGDVDPAAAKEEAHRILCLGT